MTWKDIWRQGSHEIELGRIIKDARSRLTEIKCDDIDCLASIRLAGKPRIWGIKDHHILHVLWWDPEHEICPSPLKHT
jgi:hypothetical protein